MQKSYYHNGKSANENKKQKISTQIMNVKRKSIVDINILLNRVKLDQKNETKRKIIFFIFTTIALSLFGIFITFIK
tara:strand:- start:94 stop:321 length:228 start_codon:yes stop_codon:yes gene_type:complete